MKKITESMHYIQKGSLILKKNYRTLFYCSSNGKMKELGTSGKAENIPKDGSAYLFVEEKQLSHHRLKVCDLAYKLTGLAHEDILRQENVDEVPF